jgi:HD-GYP domain-containing protein (c-di-GMP phosphodiesterase class II)
MTWLAQLTKFGAGAETSPEMDLEGLVAEARERRPQPMPSRERLYAGASAVAFLGAIALMRAVLPHGGVHDPLLLVLPVLLYALAQRCLFELGQGMALPTQIAFVPMLFLAPAYLVPLLVALGALLGRAPDFLLKKAHPDRWLHSFSHAWYAVAPAAIIALAAPGPPQAKYIPVYAAALLAQSVVGIVEAAFGDAVLFGVPIRDTLRSAAFGYWIDVMLTPVAFMVATVAVHEPATLIGVAPLFWLLRSFSKERTERLASAHELNQTYRGTVMVLADVVEADDDYTASHCRSVVELCAATGAELGLGDDAMQELEIAALLHDVGKIAIPDEILNKPARLTDDEFELMKTHTIEGQALLSRVGGKLARIGEVVRSCHERWDGRGYPDGLMGEEIPLAARIVFCCDAFSAMTTDRPYRQAMSQADALAELRDNSGGQFEPRVVDAVVTVVEEGRVEEAEAYSDAVRAVLATHPPAGAPSLGLTA